MDELLIVYFTNFHEHEVMDVCHLIQIDGLERYSQQHIAKSDSTRTLPWHIYIYACGDKRSCVLVTLIYIYI
jgi:hypothetical protein